MNLKKFQTHFKNLPQTKTETKEEISEYQQKIKALAKVVATTTPTINPAERQSSIEALEELVTSLKEGRVFSFSVFAVADAGDDQHQVLNIINGTPLSVLAAGFAIEDALGRPLKDFEDASL